MKIIRIDNFNRDEVSDLLVAENIDSKVYGERMVKGLNFDNSPHNPDYFKLVEDDYKLYEFKI